MGERWNNFISIFRGKKTGSAMARMHPRQLAKLQAEINAELLKRTYGPGDLIESYSTDPDWSPYSAQDAVTNGLEANVWVGRCLSLWMTSVASVPVLVKRRDGDKWVHEPESDFQKLINSPNSEWSWLTFAMMVTGQAKLSGESYITKQRGSVAPPSEVFKGRRQPVGLWAHMSDAFAPVKGGENEPFVKHYEPKKKGLKQLDPKDVVHFKLAHPADPWHGLSEMSFTSREVQTDTAASDFQKTSLNNRAVPDGMLSLEGQGFLTDEEWDATLAKFTERAAGPENARKILALNGNVKWTDLAKSAIDLDFTNGRKMSREGICAGFDVPPVLVGILDRATYSNFDQAWLIFWLRVLPFLRYLLAELNRHLAPEFGPDWRLEADTRRIDALFPLYRKRLDAAIALRAASGAPWSVLNETFDLHLIPWEGWDQPAS